MRKELFNQQENIYKYTLKNDFLSVSILNYGGIIQEILCPDIYQKWENIVLGYDNFDSYKSNTPYLGCVVGRMAGRIASGQFHLEDTKYQLNTNSAANHLHGGIYGLDKKIWQEEEFIDSRLVLSYYSPHGEEHYPGNVHILLTYQLMDNTLEWSIEATTDQTTTLNLTNHSYFNLSAGKLLGIDQLLQLDSDLFFELDNQLIPSGELISSHHTPFDFRSFKTIKQDLYAKDTQLQIAEGYDHCFLLNDTPIILRDRLSKRQLTIKTNQQSCVFYSGNFLNESMGPLSNNQPCRKHLGICLETQAPPNSINISDYKNLVTLSPKEIYRHENIWDFSTY